MSPTLALVSAMVLASAGPVETRFAQIVPQPWGPALSRTVGQRRAVLLLHGLRLHPFSEANSHKASFDPWQKPGTKLVRSLAKDADVYAFSYSQNASLDELTDLSALAEGIGRLRALGYAEVVLIGHSAGGVIARQFVEDHPEAGVTKVIQVCAPNTGSSWAKLGPAVLRGQEEFVRSLSKEQRKKSLQNRAGKLIPSQVEFACLVGTSEIIGDGLVSCASQWPEDLQRQGVPAYGVFAFHPLVMWTDTGVSRIASLVRAELPRWCPEQVALARQRLLLQPERDPAKAGRAFWGTSK